MPVPLQIPVTNHIGNGVTTLFAFNFTVLRASSVRVTVNDVVQTQGSAYTVAGVGSPTGSVTFAVPPASGAEIQISRNTLLKRDRDYQTGGDLLADTIDLDLDDLWLAMQEISLRAGGDVPPAPAPGPSPSPGGGGGYEVIGTPANFPGLDPTGSTDPAAVAANTAALQAFFDACRGKRGYLPAGRYKKNAQITLDPVYSYTIEGAGWSSENGTPQGTSIEETNDSNGLLIYYANANFPGGPAGATPPRPNSDNRVRLARLAFRGPNVFTEAGTQVLGIEGVATSVPKGTGIYCYWVQGLHLEDVWISQYQRDGLYGYRCFSVVLDNVWAIKNNYSGIVFFKTANAVKMSGVKSLVNGRVGATSPHYSISITSDIENFASLGPVIDGASDTSYPGYDSSSPYFHAISKGNLASIVVAGGVATANGSGFLFSPGQVVGVFGCTTVRSLNSLYATTLIGATSTQLTFAAPGVPNGTYTETNLSIGPYGVGIGLNQIFGGKVNAYCEDPSGVGMYVGAQCKGLSIEQGYYQDARILIDTGARGISMSEVHFAGIRAGDFWADPLSMAAWVGQQYSNLPGRGQAIGGSNLVSCPAAAPFQAGTILVWSGNVGGGLRQLSNLGIGRATLFALDTTNSVLLGTAVKNTAVGDFSGVALVTGESNTYLGSGAGRNNVSGSANINIGRDAGPTGGNVQASIYMGAAAGAGVQSGGDEIAIGTTAGAHGSAAPTNGKNVFIGNNAGFVNSNQVWGTSVIIGHQDGPSAGPTGVTNFIGVGHNTMLNAAVNRFQAGNGSISQAVVQVGWTIASDSRLKYDVADLSAGMGLNFVKQLRPVTYYRANKQGVFRNGLSALASRVGLSDAELPKREIGFLAQEILAQLPTGMQMVERDFDADQTYMFKPDELIACLVKAVQQLDARLTAIGA